MRPLNNLLADANEKMYEHIQTLESTHLRDNHLHHGSNYVFNYTILLSICCCLVLIVLYCLDLILSFSGSVTGFYCRIRCFSHFALQQESRTCGVVGELDFIIKGSVVCPRVTDYS